MPELYSKSDKSEKSDRVGNLKITNEEENPFAKLVSNQTIVEIPSYTLESGIKLKNFPVAFKTYGKLNKECTNCMVICHALTGSADVEDWWGPLIGCEGKAFDISRFFIICLNSLGSPYGSASPCTINTIDTSDDESENDDINDNNLNKDNNTVERFGPHFPLVTVRDDVNIHKIILDSLGVKQIAVVIGGSMGGMLVLEYAYFGKDFVRSIIPIATSARHSAWCISWGEAQRQAIYSDPKYLDGYYPFDDPPVAGLAAARMSALLTYRSRNSFERRFGRDVPDLKKSKTINAPERQISLKPSSSSSSVSLLVHNDGNGYVYHDKKKNSTKEKTLQESTNNTNTNGNASNNNNNNNNNNTSLISKNGQQLILSNTIKRIPQTKFSAQSYLRYQGQKFVKRFDANCYIAITRKLDTHDVTRGRVSSDLDPDKALETALSMIEQPTLVLGIQSDGLFLFSEQQEIAKYIPNGRLEKIDSPEGHDAFLLEFERVNSLIIDFLKENLSDIMDAPPTNPISAQTIDNLSHTKKASVFGEAEEIEITSW